MILFHLNQFDVGIFHYVQRYNKAEKDFPTLLEYNNYLEEVEDISKLLLA